MGEGFIDDLIQRDALKPLNGFSGRALIVQGDADTTIDLKNADLILENLKQAKQKKLLIMKGADHGFGLWDSRPEDSEKLVDETVGFLSET